jgi:ABC-type branched-subunit amino acid transport system substrate-binding protein
MVAAVGAACTTSASFASAQADSSRKRRWVVTQLADTSIASQDVSKDFLVGSRAAWQEVNAAGGIRGQLVSHEVIETDGSVASADAAWKQAASSSESLMCFGTVGDALAQHLSRSKFAEQAQMAHVAPWLQGNSLDTDNNTLHLFANREEQLAYTIRTLSVAGLNNIAVVFGNRELQAQNINDVRTAARRLNIRLQEIEAQSDLQSTASRLRNSTAPIIVFVGGTPELVQFASGVQRTGLQRYLVAMADVNLQTAQQMGIADNTPLIATQAVPLVNSSTGIARRYRTAMSRFFDEPPTPHSLAGYIAAQAAIRVISNTDGPVNRASVLRTVRGVNRLDLDGFLVNYQNNRRVSAYVTQSMLGANGRTIG